MHALSIYWNGGNTSAIIMGAVSELGGGILAGGYFIFLYEISGTIFLPVLIHAILDYPYGKQSTDIYFTVILTIYCMVLLFINTYMKKLRKGKKLIYKFKSLPASNLLIHLLYDLQFLFF